jgi:PKD repeat protein
VGSSSVAVTVNDVAPTVTLNAPSSGTAGTPFSFTASASDPSPVDQAGGFTYNWNFGDGTSGTGANPSHTYASPGSYTVSVTAASIADGATSMQATSALVISAVIGSTINIDASWLQQRGAGPYYLDTAGATYVLQTDVTVDGTAFMILNKNITFDLNGHTITYGNSQPITVPNGGFEDGATPTDIPNWDVSQAPGAARVPAITGMWGNWMLQLPNITSTETLSSAPITIPNANLEYAAAITPKGTSGSTVTLSVIDTVTGAVLGSASSRDPSRGFGAVVRFTPTTTDPVKLKVDVTPPTGKTATVDLDYASVTRSRDYGVVASKSPWDLPAQLVTTYVASMAPYVSNFTLENGNIQQGAGQSYGGSVLVADTCAGTTVDHIVATASGDDTSHMEFQYSSNITVTNSTLIGQITRITDRMRQFAALGLDSTYGTITLTNNQFSGTMQTPIFVGRAMNQTVTAPTLISGNTIRQNALATDAYGIVINNLWNFEVASNTITPVNGRGILLDGFNNSDTENGRIHDNVVQVQEHANLEYDQTGLEAIALRVRNVSSSKFRNLSFYNNTFSATTGPGGDWAAAGARISLNNVNGQLNVANITFTNNTFRAILTAPIPNLVGYRSGGRAWGLTLAGISAGTGLTFTGNTMDSNFVSLNFGDDDGWTTMDDGVLFVGNTISKSSAGATLSYVSIAAGDWGTGTNNIQMVDTQYVNGATSGVLFLGTQAKQISFGVLLNVSVVDSSGNPVSGATVTILDQAGNQVFTGTTNQGTITGIPLMTTTLYVAQGGDDNNPTRTANNPFTISATSGTKSATETLTLNGDQSTTLQLP